MVASTCILLESCCDWVRDVHWLCLFAHPDHHFYCFPMSLSTCCQHLFKILYMCCFQRWCRSKWTEHANFRKWIIQLMSWAKRSFVNPWSNVTKVYEVHLYSQVTATICIPLNLIMFIWLLVHINTGDCGSWWAERSTFFDIHILGTRRRLGIFRWRNNSWMWAMTPIPKIRGILSYLTSDIIIALSLEKLVSSFPLSQRWMFF